jgi:nicotinamidase-related amidase
MNKIVLMVVDVQTLLIKYHPYHGQKVIDNINKLISAARADNKEVIFVRHNDVEGLKYGSDNWQIYSEIVPDKNEKIFDKQYNSALRKTGLKEYLDSKMIDTIILTGLQTEYCIDATCKAAFEYGYHVIIPEETNTTFDNKYLSAEKLYEFYNYDIWNNRFADVMPLEKVISLLGETKEV